jgi:flagella basal body P-ring formation protein FlgA
MGRLRPLAVGAVLLLGVTAGLAAQAADDPIRAAVAAAVAAHVGPDAAVDVRGMDAVDLPGPLTQVELDPAARMGAPMTVLLFTGPASSVRVRADVHVILEHARASRAIERGHLLTADDLAPARSEVFGMPLRALPTPSQLIGGRALRVISAGEIFQAGFVTIQPIVRAGTPVTAIARVGDVEVSAAFVAVDSGNAGDVIRIANPDSHRTLRARVVSAGTVEVLNVQ